MAGTVAKILQFTNPVADANGKSQLTGIDDATAFGLEAMRQKLAPVLNGGGVDKGHVAELEALAACLRDGGPWPIPLEEQLRAMRIAFAVEREILAAPRA